jgi:hypothetical protein
MNWQYNMPPPTGPTMNYPPLDPMQAPYRNWEMGNQIPNQFNPSPPPNVYYNPNQAVSNFWNFLIMFFC